MVDTQRFMEAVDKSGLKMRYIADELGMTYTSLYRKSRNMARFRKTEVEAFCKVVGLKTKADRDVIFVP